MAAFNACITVGYVAGASLKGINLNPRDQDPRRARPARLPRHQRCRGARATRTIDYEVTHQGRRIARGFRGNPPDGHEDVAQLLQHEPSDQNERIAPRRLTQHSAPRRVGRRRRTLKRGVKKNMADLGIQKVNPNKALWEKGDFTRIAETMRESGEESGRDARHRAGHERARPRLRRRNDGASCREARRQRARRRHRREPRCRGQRPRAGGWPHQPALPRKATRPISAASLDGHASTSSSASSARCSHRRPFDVAKEMVRVTKPGGRIVMGNWIPGDPTLVAQILKISAAYTPPPPEGFVSPMTWGDEAKVRERFEAAGIAPENISFEQRDLVLPRRRPADRPASTIVPALLRADDERVRGGGEGRPRARTGPGAQQTCSLPRTRAANEPKSLRPS